MLQLYTCKEQLKTLLMLGFVNANAEYILLDVVHLYVTYYLMVLLIAISLIIKVRPFTFVSDKQIHVHYAACQTFGFNFFHEMN